MITTRVKVFPEAIAAAQQALAAAAKGITPHEATMGVHEEQGGEAKRGYDGREQAETLVEIMMQHEYGDAGVPERSFIRAWFDARMATLAGGMFDAMRAEADGDKQAVHRWVKATYDEWIAWVRGGGLPPLSPRTVALKAKHGLPHPDTPLVATEQFVRAWRAKLDGQQVGP
jgi:hypothetical protein